MKMYTEIQGVTFIPDTLNRGYNTPGGKVGPGVVLFDPACTVTFISVDHGL